MSFSRCLDIWGLIGEMRSDPVSRLPQNTRYASGVLICFLVELSTAKLPLNCMLIAELEGVLQGRLQS